MVEIVIVKQIIKNDEMQRDYNLFYPYVLIDTEAHHHQYVKTIKKKTHYIFCTIFLQNVSPVE